MRSRSSAPAACLTFVLLSLAVACSPSAADEPSGESSDELRSCAVGTTVKGIDVSTYQGAVSWASVKAGGRVFAFARVSDGTSHVDPRFDINWSEMAAAGVIRGAYQYFRPGQSAAAQADLFLSKVGPLGDRDLPPALDVETDDRMSAATIRAGIKAWIDRVERQLGRRVIVYTMAGFMTKTIGDAFASQPLWVANFGATCPTMPVSWMKWSFFQSSGSGTANGVGTEVDLDVFNGTLADLHAFIGASQAGASTSVGSQENEGAPNGSEPVAADDTASATGDNGSCYSATLGETVSALACVESRYDGGGWFQCHAGQWFRGGDDGRGPYGTCASSTPL